MEYQALDNTTLRILFQAIPVMIENGINPTYEEFERVISETQKRQLQVPEDRVEALVVKYNVIGHTELLHKCWRFVKAKEFELIINGLVNEGRIYRVKWNGLDAYATPKWKEMRDADEHR